MVFFCRPLSLESGLDPMKRLAAGVRPADRLATLLGFSGLLWDLLRHERVPTATAAAPVAALLPVDLKDLEAKGLPGL